MYKSRDKIVRTCKDFREGRADGCCKFSSVCNKDAEENVGMWHHSYYDLPSCLGTKEHFMAVQLTGNLGNPCLITQNVLTQIARKRFKTNVEAHRRSIEQDHVYAAPEEEIEMFENAIAKGEPNGKDKN